MSEQETGTTKDKYIQESDCEKTISLVMIALLVGLCVWAKTPEEALKSKEAPQPPFLQPTPSGVHEMTAADVEAFLDGLVPLQIKPG